jgi:hypothetical protein
MREKRGNNRNIFFRKSLAFLMLQASVETLIIKNKTLMPSNSSTISSYPLCLLTFQDGLLPLPEGEGVFRTVNITKKLYSSPVGEN